MMRFVEVISDDNNNSDDDNDKQHRIKHKQYYSKKHETCEEGKEKRNKYS